VSSSTDQDQDLDAAPPAAALPDERLQCFPEDSGQLQMGTRRVITQLLQGPFIDGRRHSKLWPTLLREEATVRSRLHELFMELIIDRDAEVAFTRKVVAEGLDAPVLLRSSHLTFIESAVLLYLRKKLTEADAAGERMVVDFTDIRDHLRTYEKDGNVDKSRFEVQIRNAVEKMKKMSLLRTMRATEDRFEVSPTLKLLFSAEEIVVLTQVYEKLRETPQEAAALTTDEEASEQEEVQDE